MRIVAGLGILLLVSGISAVAQTPAASSNSDGIVCSERLVPGTSPEGSLFRECRSALLQACPLYMHVGQRAGGTLITTDDQGRRVKMFAARLRLELKDQRPERSGQRMVSATVTVSGWNPQARAVPLDASGAGKGSRVRTMTVPLSGGGVPEASADLELPGFTAARLVRLDSVSFEDGQVLTLHSCQVAPDMYMPVEDWK